MENVPDGIYFVMGEPTEGSPVVLVHPRFQGAGYDRIFDEKNPDESKIGNYGRNVERLVSSNSGPVVLIESQYHAAETGDWIGRLTDKDIYTIHTKDGSTSKPENISWAEVARFIAGFGNSIKMAGGNLTYYKGEYSGCLGSAYEALKKEGLDCELVTGCCFVKNNY